MQNRIDELFEQKKENILSIFFTAGFPRLNDTLPILEALERSDADIIEVGIPFSDPLADGPIIQHSSLVSLENGMNLKLLFTQLTSLRKATSKPVLLMGYLNSVIQFGIEDFYRTCSEVAVDGVILPDLPIDEFEASHKKIAEQFGIKIIFLISPETKDERVQLLDSLSSGFVYVLSSNSTTGGRKRISEKLRTKLKTLKNPSLVGFGIKGQKEFSEACEVANGAIIGSAFVECLSRSKDLESDILEFTSSIKQKSIIR